MTKSRQQRDKKNEDKAKAKLEQKAQAQRDGIEQDLRAEYEKQREIDARRLELSLQQKTPEEKSVDEKIEARREKIKTQQELDLEKFLEKLPQHLKSNPGLQVTQLGAVKTKLKVKMCRFDLTKAKNLKCADVVEGFFKILQGNACSYADLVTAEMMEWSSESGMLEYGLVACWLVEHADSHGELDKKVQAEVDAAKAEKAKKGKGKKKKVQLPYEILLEEVKVRDPKIFAKGSNSHQASKIREAAKVSIRKVVKKHYQENDQGATEADAAAADVASSPATSALPQSPQTVSAQATTNDLPAMSSATPSVAHRKRSITEVDTEGPEVGRKKAMKSKSSSTKRKRATPASQDQYEDVEAKRDTGPVSKRPRTRSSGHS